ncbi:MAG TPA: hypothetical protein VIS95_08400 [Solirubrobacterales bacterium]
MRNIKAFGLALVAICATSALGSATASATDLFTVGGAEKAWVTGSQHQQQFKFTNSILIECTTSKLTGTIVNGASEMTALTSHTGTLNIVPHTPHCESALGGVTFHMNGCHDVLTGNTDAQTDATVWIQCPTGKEIVLTIDILCTIRIPSQTPTEGGVTYKNLPNHPGGSAIEIATTMTGVTYKSEGFCGSGVADNLDYSSTMSLTGYKHLGGTMAVPIEGERVPIEVS